MYDPMLYVHWKQAKLAMIPFVVAAFGLPLLAIQGLGPEPEGLNLNVTMAWLPLFPALAGAIGVVLALTAWNWDHQQSHVYALTLPMARWEYAMHKMGAGVALGLMPVTAFWIGAHLASASLTLPVGLNAYPNQLTLRFLFAVLVSYALLFAMAAGTVRTTIWILTGVVVFFVAGGLLNDVLAFFFPYFQEANIVGVVSEWLFTVRGPFGVFTGNWALIDV